MFCRIRASIEYLKVSVLEKRGHFLDEKVSGKGSLLILENDHTSYLLHLSGGTGPRSSLIHDQFLVITIWLSSNFNTESIFYYP